MKIAVKLISGFLFVALIAGIIGVIGLINLNTISEADTLLYEENTLGIDYAGNAAIYFQRIRYNSVKMIAVDDEHEKNACVDNINNYSIKVEEFLKLYEDGIITDTDRNLFDKLKPQWKNYKSLINQAISYLQSGEADQAKKIIFGEADTEGEALRVAFNDLYEYNSTGGQMRAESNAQLAKTSTILMIAVIVTGVIIAVALGLFIARIISKPIKKMASAAELLSIGDINVNVEANTKDEVGILAKSFRKMIATIKEQALAAERIAAGDLTVDIDIKSQNDLLGKKLSEIVEKNNEILNNIALAAEQVAAGAKQISKSSIVLSQGATEQASSIEELTASLEEISSQTKLNAENSNKANELAQNARSNAEKGNKQMVEMLAAMEEINNSSSNISKIIKVIDEIAFQTNILALNAAVEAARAGQHGKGFAVVAEEVRNLAARSANAAKETTELIENSIKKAEEGTKILQNTANALSEIVSAVDKVADLVHNIAMASNEQTAGIEQINQGILQVSQVVQENSSTSEEGASASEELSSQAELLKEMISKFKLKKSDITESDISLNSPDAICLHEKNRLQGSGEIESFNTKGKTNTPVNIFMSEKEFGKY